MKLTRIGTLSLKQFHAHRAPRSAVFICVALGCSALTGALSGQIAGKVDFAKDVQPLFQENCLDCHGPSKQKAGLRLDRRSSVIKSFARRVVPGNSPNSMVYERVVGSEYGMQMPPKGALPPEHIATIKAWIDQGAEWPDALANELDLPPLNPKAIAMVESLRSGDLSSFMKAVEAEPNLLNARGPEGSTPFMYAVLYTDAGTLARLLKLGADPNKHNDANATALMWAANDLKKTRLLVRHGADVNARSDDYRTPLMIAARHPGGTPIVKFLLDNKANPNPNSKPLGESSPLMEALTAGDEGSAALLIGRGADAKATADMGLTMAVTMNCPKGLELLAQRITDTNVYTLALQNTANLGDLKAVRLMLEHGADANAFDPLGRTPLMYAAISDLLPLDVVKLLVEHGADVNALNKHTRAGDAGLTVLDIAKLNGRTPIVEYLEAHGAKSRKETAVALQPRQGNTIRRAVEDSLPLLQRTDVNFSKGAGCTSCHNNSLSAMAVGLARERGLRVNEENSSAQVKVNLEEFQARRDKLHEGYYAQAVGDMFSDFIIGYQLVGLHAQNCQPDLNTDSAVMMIRSRQKPTGEWAYPHADTRPPICLDYIGQTALAMRAVQLYRTKTTKAACDKSVRLAAAWLSKAQSMNNEDRAWRLTGLAWAGTDKGAIKKAVEEVLANQRPDGGWSDLPSMPSTPYATGRSLVALQLGGLAVSDPAYQRGIKVLLNTQQEDGSWYTRTRALAFQPYFDSGFPHGYNQWVSAAATSWATMALTLALPEQPHLTALRVP
jgi:ankyrin repeat protein